MGRGCVKTQKNFVCLKIDLLKRPLRDFFDIGNGRPTHGNFGFWSFCTASDVSCQSKNVVYRAERAVQLPDFLNMVSFMVSTRIENYSWLI